MGTWRHRHCSDAERLARAVLLFHKGPPWDRQDQENWNAVTGTLECSSKNLCDLARYVALREMEKPRGTDRDPNLMIEGVASQMRRTDAPLGPIPWWDLAGTAERERYRAKARNHLAGESR